MKASFANWNYIVSFGHFLLNAAVEKFMFQEEHWIIVAHRRFNQSFGIAGRSRGHNFHAWRMDKIHFRILRMEGTTVDAASGGAAQHQRSRSIPAVMRLGHHIDNLVEG